MAARPLTIADLRANVLTDADLRASRMTLEDVRESALTLARLQASLVVWLPDDHACQPGAGAATSREA